MDQPTFSICIPNYNYAQYIGKTIQSVLEQTYPHYEIIVADNASTDDSVKVVESFSSDKIRLIRNKYNIGFAPNLQRATMYARNDFINLLSSDDLMKPTALETYAQILMAQGVNAVRTILMADAEIIDGEGEVWGIIKRSRDFARSMTLPLQTFKSDVTGQVTYSVHNGLQVLSDSLRQLVNPAPFLTLMYPRPMWEAVEGYNGIRTIGPDKHFAYKLLFLDPNVIYVHEPLFRYREHSSRNQAAFASTLKQPIDDYMYTIEYTEADLQRLGLKRRDLISALLDRVCLGQGLTELSEGNYEQALRLLAFSLASYPDQALRLWRFYLVTALLALGPLSRFVAAALRTVYRRFRSKPEPFDPNLFEARL